MTTTTKPSYETTINSCLCKAREFNPKMPCKHMIALADQIAQAEVKERKEAESFYDECLRMSRRYHPDPKKIKTHWVCACREYYESRDYMTANWWEGECAHTKYQDQLLDELFGGF